MTNEIQIEIPLTGSNPADLIRYFQERLGILTGAMDRDVANFDERAQIDEVHVRKVEVIGERIAVTYELHFSAYYGCSELDYSGQHLRVLFGYREGNFWIFRQHQALPSRSTLDEF